MDEHDPDGLALLVVRRRDEQGEIEPDARAATRRSPASQGRSRPDRRHEARRIGQFDQASHAAALCLSSVQRCSNRLRASQCGRWPRRRSLIPPAAAPQPRRRCRPRRRRATRRRASGRASRTAPAAKRAVRGRDAEDQHGIISGSDQDRQDQAAPRGATAVSAAPIAPMKVSAGVPTSSVAATGSIARGRQRDEQAEAAARRSPAAGRSSANARATLASTSELERQRRGADQVERAVLLVAPGTAGRGRSGSPAAAPIQRIAGPMRDSRLRSGPERERHQRRRSSGRTGAPSSAPPPIAGREREVALASSAAEAPGTPPRRRRPIRSSARRARPSGACVAAMSEPPACEMAPASARRACPGRPCRAPPSARRAARAAAARRGAAPARRAAAARPRDRRPAGRRHAARPTAASASPAASPGSPRRSRGEDEVLRAVSAVFSAVAMADEMAGSARPRSPMPLAATLRPRAASRPRASRAGVDLPAPLRPVSAIASPPRGRRTGPAKIRRPAGAGEARRQAHRICRTGAPLRRLSRASANCVKARASSVHQKLPRRDIVRVAALLGIDL